MYVVHAEMNAILNKNSASVSGARLYVALFPCNECAKIIIQSGIREVRRHPQRLHSLPAPVTSADLRAIENRIENRKATQQLTTAESSFPASPTPYV